MTAPGPTTPEVIAPATGDARSAPPRDLKDEELAEIVSCVSSELTSGAGTEGAVQTVVLSFARMHSDIAFPMEVQVRHVAEVLNRVAGVTVLMGLHDVQFWVQRRVSKGAQPEAIHGVIVDVDVQVTDILAEVERAGIPMPAAYFPTQNGYKLVYAFAAVVDVAVFEQIGQRLTLALDGGDPASWNPSQGQRLPKCLKTTTSGVVAVDFTAQLANPVALAPVVEVVPFPRRVQRQLGAWNPSPSDRERIRDYLAEVGIPAPEDSGKALYAACPASEEHEHDSKCCYVNVHEGGAIKVTCLGGHAGEGEKHWSERDLLLLAGGEAAADSASFDLMRDLPVTWAAKQLFEDRLRDWSPSLRGAAFATWMYEKALREAESPEGVDRVLSIYRQRLTGDPAFGPVHMYFSEVEQRLAYHDAAGRRYFVSCKESGPSTRSNLHECQSTAAWALVEEENKDGTSEYVPGWEPTTSSLMNKLMVGQRSALRVLGVPAVTRYDLPVAHVKDGWDVEPGTKIVTATLAFAFPPNTKEIPALDFFLGLFRAGRLPLATENDVRLFVACLSAPLLRDVGRGQLGIYWLIGPPGAGKDFMAEMAEAIWGAVSAHPLRVSFDINITNDLEMKRSFAAAEGAVFARAKEAGKRLGMVETLIQVAGTRTLTARGMRENERSIPNSFVIVADSAEDLPDRREISRRTVMISVADMDDSISKGAVLDEVKQAAPGLLLHLKRLIESKTPEWYLGQADTRSRLLIPVALSRLLDATLPEVKGQDLSDIFEAMIEFIATPVAKEEGERERKKAIDRGVKESLEMKTLPSYRMSLFIDQMKGIAGYRELFATFGDKAKALTTRIIRESNYANVRAGKVPYLTVKIGNTDYALKFTRSSRNFILVPVEYYEQQMSSSGKSPSPPTTPATQADTEETGPAPQETMPLPSDAPPSSTPTVFSDDELLNTEDPGSAKGGTP
ncbi:hypothetical protein [Sorangium sp. So ce861]|uniref:hypothetical protein n=1 Tax=Sorangium sp. So ce861 TaxID=3133323 RepID=UPI003F61B5CA